LRFVAVHGHFYQPPRENPWLDTVEVQDSAAPAHDWNERITEECYAPNTAARRLSADNRVIGIVNNFEKISFNVGPTLMAWLARHRPDVHASIVGADRASRAARGHGNALAQVYNHMIMPLASRRDRITQVHWGIGDFRARFGRDPEGMWLPETAVDSDTLEILAEAGIQFTILAPHQAARVRPIAGGDWQDVGEAIDPSRPYRWTGPSGQSLVLFFYDAPVSRAIAFENVLQSGEVFARRLLGAFHDERTWPQLVHCATDGESYGHHSRFGEMALAAALERIEARDDVVLTNYAAFLAASPPDHEVEIRDNTSWSCPHGVERWRAECGCRLDPDTRQEWRRPLREALDWLAGEIDALYEARTAGLLKDPWEARDAYIEVLAAREGPADGAAPRGAAALEHFLAEQASGPLAPAARVEARQLLEMQRQRLLMFASCGWFFDDLAGLEPVQDLRYAAMALQYLRELGGADLEPALLDRLGAARSNDGDEGTGADVYRRRVRPAAADERRLTAHYAITGLFETPPREARVYAHQVTRLDETSAAYGDTALRVGRVRVSSELTGQVRDALYAVAHFGGHDITCGVRLDKDGAAYAALQRDLLDRYARRSLSEVVRGFDGAFGRDTFSVTDLFLEERRRVLGALLGKVVARHESTVRHVWDETHALLDYLREADVPIPETLRVVARRVLEQDALAALADALGRLVVPPRVFELLAHARKLHLELNLVAARPLIRGAVERAIDRVAEQPSEATVAQAVALVETAQRLGSGFGLWAAQNRFFALWTERPAMAATLAPLARALGFAA
jgi:alpha-amylase/alpha-mannosidase (GH57 family)